MYTPCLPFAPYQIRWVCTCGWAIHEANYLNPKIGGGGGGGGEEGERRERDLRCNSFTSQWKSKAISVQPNISQIWLVIIQVKNPATKTRWQGNVIGRVRKKLSNMSGVFSKSISGYFLPIFDHCYFVFYNYGLRNPLDYIHPNADWVGIHLSLITNL